MPGATESPKDIFTQLNLNIILKYLPYYWKQLMQMITMVPGQGGRFQSVCFPKQIQVTTQKLLTLNPASVPQHQIKFQRQFWVK